MKKGVSVLFFIILFSISACAAPNSDIKKYEKLRIFAKVMAIIDNNYVDNVSDVKLVDNAIKGMVSSLDPHSSYMTKDEYKELQIVTTGKFGGLGIEITLKDGMLTVVAPIEDTPAYKAGIKAQDVIIKINSKSTLGMSLQDAVKILRGKPDTKVTLTILRKKQNKPLKITITRAIIHVKSVKYKKFDDIGYLRISQFQQGTSKEVKRALKKLGKINGLVLDLRNNPGGLLKEAVEVSDIFIKKGVIVSIRGKNKANAQYFYAKDDENEPQYPMVVLINAGSASASEIVTGCLKDDKRAVVMGIKSFGKGSVQSIIPLSDGSALRLTTAKYYTPSGVSIQALGIEPDIVVKQAKLIEESNGLSFRENDLVHHLKSSKIVKKEERTKEPAKIAKTLKSDYQLLRAVELIKAEDIICSKKQR